MSISFVVLGIPRPAGSKRGLAIRKGGQLTGRVAMVDASGQHGREWRQDVKAAARQAMAGKAMFGGPIALNVDLVMPRPKSHRKRNGAVKDDAPTYHTHKPDATKLLRSIEDSCTGIVWYDDAQIAVQQVAKRYGPDPGAMVTVRDLWVSPAPEHVRD